jgi:hypothetical protein
MIEEGLEWLSQTDEEIVEEAKRLLCPLPFTHFNNVTVLDKKHFLFSFADNTCQIAILVGDIVTLGPRIPFAERT